MDPAVPFGGYKMSGYGSESGLQQLAEYLKVKAVWIKMEATVLVGVCSRVAAAAQLRPGVRTQAPFVAYGIQILGLSEKRDD